MVFSEGRAIGGRIESWRVYRLMVTERAARRRSLRRRISTRPALDFTETRTAPPKAGPPSTRRVTIKKKLPFAAHEFRVSEKNEASLAAGERSESV